MSSSANDSQAPSTSGRSETQQEPEPAEPSTKHTGMGWLEGPKANLPNKTRRIEDEWEALKDSSGQVYYRSILTGEATVPNCPKPETWTEVVDKRTGLLYYWNRRTREATALGEPKPGPYGRAAAPPDADGGSGLLESGRGGSKADRGPSLMGLVTNPLVMGVTLMALAAIGYELLFKSS